MKSLTLAIPLIIVMSSAAQAFVMFPIFPSHLTFPPIETPVKQPEIGEDNSAK